MLKVLVFGIGVLAAGPAWAGCYHYSGEGAFEPTQKAPRVEICFKGKCEKTAVEYECGNATGAVTAFQNGFSVAVGTNEAGENLGPVVSYRGSPVKLSAVSCKSLDEDACHLFSF